MKNHALETLELELKKLQANQQIWSNKLSFDIHNEEYIFWVADFQKKIYEVVLAISILNQINK